MPRKKNIKYSKENIYICPCGVEAKDDVHKTYFSWQNLGGTVVMLCWACADKLHKDALKQSEDTEVVLYWDTDKKDVQPITTRKPSWVEKNVG